MQEFSINLKDHINAGLRKDFRGGRDQFGLISLFNHKPTRWGLRQVELPVIPTALQTAMTSASITVSHPFPQLFHGKGLTFLLTATQLYTVNTTTWALTQVSTFNPDDDTTLAITTGNSWHFVDYKDAYVFFNGVVTIIKGKDTSLLGGTDLAYVFSTPFINTGVDFRGRVVFGGFSDGVWKNEWTDFWESFDPAHELATSFSIDNNSVMWTSVAGSELMWLIKPELILDGDNTKVIQLLKKNQFGWKRLDHQGDVLRIVPLDDSLIVYGSNGVTQMFPVDSPYPTFGFRKLLDYGINSRSSVINANGRHIFLTKGGVLREFTKDGGVKRLGFSEFFTSMDGNDVVLSYAPEEEERGDVIISDGSTSFLLTDENKLCEISKLYTSSAFIDSTSVGIFEDTSVNSFELITDALSFNTAARKTVTSVEVTGTDTTEMTAALDYSLTKAQSFSRTGFKKSNLEGISYPRAGGYEHRVVLRATDYTKIEIDDLDVKVQYDDKRNIRGLTAAARGGQDVSQT